MSTVKQLSRHLRILELFGFQFFSLSTFRLNSDPKCASKGFILYFFVRISFLALATGYLWLYFIRNFDGISLKKNVLGYLLKVASSVLSSARSFNTILEAFVRIKSNQKFFVLLGKSCDFLSANFGAEISFDNFENVLRRRLRYLTAFSVVVVIFDVFTFKVVKSALVIVQLSFHFVSHMGGFLIIYKFCLYIDLIALCLVKFCENLDVLTVGNVKREKINRLRRSYIYIIELADELSSFMFLTISTFTVCEFVWTLTRFYLVFQTYAKGTGIEKALVPIFHLATNIVDFSFLAMCCQNIDNIMSKIIDKINSLEDRLIDQKGCQVALRMLYDQIIVQPIKSSSFGVDNMNKIFLVEVLISILSNVILLIQFEN